MIIDRTHGLAEGLRRRLSLPAIAAPMFIL